MSTQISKLITGGVVSVTGTSPVVSSGGTSPVISMPVATTSVNGYLRSTDWTTFNAKQTALISGTNIKTINGNTLLGSGDLTISGGGGSGIHIPVRPIPGFYYSQMTIIGSSSLSFVTQANGGLQLFPFIPINNINTDLLQFEVVTAAATTLSKIVLYNDSGGKPSTKIYESVDVNSDTTGFKTIAASLSFVAGTVYWLGLVTNSSSVSVRAIPSSNFQPQIFNNSTSQVYNGWYISAAYASIPASVTVTQSNNNQANVPFIMFRAI